MTDRRGHDILEVRKERKLPGTVVESWSIRCTCLQWKEKATTEKACLERFEQHYKYPSKKRNLPGEAVY